MEEVQVSFRRPGEDRLSAYLWLPASEGPFPTIIFVTSDEEQDRVLVPYFARRGFGAIRLDLSLFSLERPSEAIRAAIDFLEEEEPRVDRRAVGLFAAGKQTLPALRCASVDHRVRALALSMPFLDAEVLRLAARVDIPACLIVEDHPGWLREAGLLADAYAGPIDVKRCKGSGRDLAAGFSMFVLEHFLRTLAPQSA